MSDGFGGFGGFGGLEVGGGLGLGLLLVQQDATAGQLGFFRVGALLGIAVIRDRDVSWGA